MNTNLFNMPNDYKGNINTFIKAQIALWKTISKYKKLIKNPKENITSWSKFGDTSNCYLCQALIKGELKLDKCRVCPLLIKHSLEFGTFCVTASYIKFHKAIKDCLDTIRIIETKENENILEKKLLEELLEKQLNKVVYRATNRLNYIKYAAKKNGFNISRNPEKALKNAMVFLSTNTYYV
jgi:hypothetical protein